MIDDSYVWKDRLRRGRAVLRRKLREGACDSARVDAAFVEVEAFVFLTGYIVRKLSEANKLSDELEAAVMRVVAYPARPEYPLDFLNAHKIDPGYDLAAPDTKTLRPKDLCNLLVHSFVFMPAADEEGTGWTGFFLNSDRTKERELVFIAREDSDHFVDEVIGDYVVTLRVNRTQKQVHKSRLGEGDPVPRISLNAAGR